MSQIHYNKMVLNYRKRDGIFKNTTGSLTFNPKTIEAHSYKWWKFVAVVEGKVIFNDYCYSSSTSKHQRKVQTLMNELGIKIDISMPLPKGINSSSLQELIETAEEYLCDKIHAEEIKKQERNEFAKYRRSIKKLESYLENDCAFRDYEIRKGSQFGTINKASTINRLVNLKDFEHDVQDALQVFTRDGFGSIIFYAEGF